MTTKLPLAGLTVVEQLCGKDIAGPWGAMVLADLGAEVFKVENPRGGDDARNWGPPFADGAHRLPGHQPQQAFRRHRPQGRKRTRGAAPLHRRAADIVLQNLRPGLVETYGLDAATLRARKPSLIYCNLTAFGAPARARPAGLRPADAGLRRHHERHRRGGPTAGARRTVDHRPGRRHVGGDRHSLRRCIGATRPARAARSTRRSTRPRSAGSAMHSRELSRLRAVPPPHRHRRTPASRPTRRSRRRDGWLVIAAGNDNCSRGSPRALGHPDWTTTRASAPIPTACSNREPLNTLIAEVVATAPRDRLARDARGGRRAVRADARPRRGAGATRRSDALGMLQHAPGSDLALHRPAAAASTASGPPLRSPPPPLGDATDDIAAARKRR